MILFVGFLLLKEPDFGAFVVITAIAFGVLFLGGINVRLFVPGGGRGHRLRDPDHVLALPASASGFMDPWQDAYGKGYQLSPFADRLRARRVVRRRPLAAASRSSSTCPRRTPTSCSP